jgi:two-component system sensor histidine kinase QseC
LGRLGDRFYRPPGQGEPGSGLGLSIVRRIAELHRLEARFENRAQGGFRATLRRR